MESNSNNKPCHLSRLVLIGGGGHCKSVLDAALAMQAFSEIVITDPVLPTGTEVLSGCRVIGTDDLLPKLRQRGFAWAFITVGNVGVSPLRRKLATMAEELGFQFPVIIDPTATISTTASIASGSFIGKHAVINADAKIGFHCIINTGVIIEHECSVGDYSHVSVGAVLCGNSHVGSESFIGAGSTVIQGVKIGNRVIVGANSTVLADVENDRDMDDKNINNDRMEDVKTVYGIVKGSTPLSNSTYIYQRN